jgi:hypothetical protein
MKNRPEAPRPPALHLRNPPSSSSQTKLFTNPAKELLTFSRVFCALVITFRPKIAKCGVKAGMAEPALNSPALETPALVVHRLRNVLF